MDRASRITRSRNPGRARRGSGTDDVVRGRSAGRDLGASCPTGSATVAPDARPHVRPISVCGLAALLLPHVGDIAEGRNLAADPRSALSMNRTVPPPLFANSTQPNRGAPSLVSRSRVAAVADRVSSMESLTPGSSFGLYRRAKTEIQGPNHGVNVGEQTAHAKGSP